jgi:hypothetical protein
VRHAPPQRLIGAGLALLGAVLVIVAAAGCRSTSYGGEGIDARALERQLQRVVALQLIQQHFYNRTVEVECKGVIDTLHLTCHVNAKNPLMPTQSWDVQVACGPPGDDDTPRCVTPEGDALQ